ncbi:MAG: hypothetical protein U5K73_00020 [Halofilum sp. (in: g-proteobacteria)]|nr:hypothetical protein [Halofilum sp. (in: g-proteobacteria)]
MACRPLVILVPWFLKYCLVMGQQAAYGRREPPNLSMENLNPLEIQPIGLAVGLIGLYQLLAHALGPGRGDARAGCSSPRRRSPSWSSRSTPSRP